MSTIQKPSPFASLLRRAAELPATTGETAHYQRRLASAGVGQVVIADVSSSMAELAGARTKIDLLREALATTPPSRLIAFGSTSREIASAAELPAPSGGTALHLALDLTATMRPARTLVISDGEPDSEDAALAAANRVPGPIDVLYVGPDSNARARAFLQRLARAGGGAYVSHDLQNAPRALAPAIRGLLGGGR